MYHLTLEIIIIKALINYQKNQIEANRKEYGIYYDQLKKISYYRLMEADEERSRLISETEGKVSYLCNGTKPFANAVSPGCRLCGEGEWSCLFVNNRCNCECFYCPTAQGSCNLLNLKDEKPLKTQRNGKI